MNYDIENLEELETFASDLLKTFKKKEHAQIIALNGDLGVGKTALTKACAKVLGITEAITSPTFVIQKEYKLSHDWYTKLIHIDAYRLESAQELEYLGWERLVSDPTNLIFIEWPGAVEGISLPDVLSVSLSIMEGGVRSIAVDIQK